MGGNEPVFDGSQAPGRQTVAMSFRRPAALSATNDDAALQLLRRYYGPAFGNPGYYTGSVFDLGQHRDARRRCRSVHRGRPRRLLKNVGFRAGLAVGGGGTSPRPSSGEFESVLVSGDNGVVPLVCEHRGPAEACSQRFDRRRWDGS
jgi:hypothetical protein